MMGKKWFFSKDKAAEAAEESKAEGSKDASSQPPPPPYDFIEAESEPEESHILAHPGHFELRYPGYSQSAVSFASNGNFELAVLGNVDRDLRLIFTRALVGLRQLHQSTQNTKELQIGQYAFTLRLPGPYQETKQTEVHRIRASDASVVLFDTSSLESLEAAQKALALVQKTQGSDPAWKATPRLPPVALVALMSSQGPDRRKVPYEQFAPVAAKFRSALYAIDKFDEDSGCLIADDLAENLVGRLEIARQLRLQDSRIGHKSSDGTDTPAIYGSAPPIYDALAPQRSTGRHFNILLGGSIIESNKREIAQAFRDKASEAHQYDFSRRIMIDDEEWHVHLVGSYGSPLGKSAWMKYIAVADGFILLGGVANFPAAWIDLSDYYKEIYKEKTEEWKENGQLHGYKPIAYVGVQKYFDISPAMERTPISLTQQFGCAWSSMRVDAGSGQIVSTMERTARTLIQRTKPCQVEKK